jgi:hypothetical protein
MLTLKHKFGAEALYQAPQESMKGFLSKRWSFWLALFSCIAFLIGNMVGQHGWKAFWKSVWGKEAAIEYAGVVAPLAGLPDYHPFHDCSDGAERDRSIYSIHYMGDYESGGHGCGSHPAADILVPKGTPVYAMANGQIIRKEERSWGFGNTIVLEFPGPDPDHSDRLTMFSAGYAHLGKILVEEGDLVHKGQVIAYSGQTGFATAAHLHFQIDRPEAPFHLYWPFTTSEATDAGMSFVGAVNFGLGKDLAYRYTLDPLAYIERYGNGRSPVLLARAGRSDVQEVEEERAASLPDPAKKTVVERLSPKEIFQLLRARVRARRAERLAQLPERAEKRKAPRIALHSVSSDAALTPASSPSPHLDRLPPDFATASPDRQGDTEGRVEMPGENIVAEPQPDPAPIPNPPIIISTAESGIPMPKAGAIASLSILHDGSFSDDWEDIVIFARDGKGNFIHSVRFEGELALESEFGIADFSPSVLTEEQFDGRGRAIVRLYPRGLKTIIPVVRGVITGKGEPMVHAPVVSVKAEAGEGG